MTHSAPEGAAYLEEAAAELRQARAANNARAQAIEGTYGGAPQFRERLAQAMVPVADRRMELGWAFLAAAAIKAGLPPCCGHARPCPEPED